MRIVLILIFGVCIFSNAYSQRDSIHREREFMIGIDLISTAKRYPGFDFELRYVFGNMMAGVKNRLIIGNNITSGTESHLYVNRFIHKRSLYTGAGIVYHQSTLEEDIIFNVLGQAYFQEVDIKQKRELKGGTLNLGWYMSNEKHTGFILEVKLFVGEESFSQTVGVPPRSVYADRQEADFRFVFTPDGPQKRFRILPDFSTTFFVKF